VPAAHHEEASVGEGDALGLLPGLRQGTGRPPRARLALPHLGALREGRRVVDPIDDGEAEAIVPASRDDDVLAAHAHGPRVEDAHRLARGLPGARPGPQQLRPRPARQVVIEVRAQHQHRAVRQRHGRGHRAPGAAAGPRGSAGSPAPRGRCCPAPGSGHSIQRPGRGTGLTVGWGWGSPPSYTLVE
jgi:hypothetical protein